MELQKAFQRREQGLFSVQEVAQQVDVSPHSVKAWLRSHDEFTNNTEYIAIEPHGKKPQRFFTTKGVIVYTNMRDTNRGNQFSKRMLSNHSKKQKESLALKAIENVKNTQVPADPIIGMLSVMTSMREEQMKQGEQIAQIQKQIEMNEKLPITTGQRKFLNERIRKFCYDNPYNDEMRVQAPVMWKAMHQKTGRRTIEEYTIEDYEVAIKWLKDMYFKYELEF